MFRLENTQAKQNKMISEQAARSQTVTRYTAAASLSPSGPYFSDNGSQHYQTWLGSP